MGYIPGSAGVSPSIQEGSCSGMVVVEGETNHGRLFERAHCQWFEFFHTLLCQVA